jgi:pantoate--beta-alanine ligase
MRTVTTVAELAAATTEARAAGGRVGLVPTMGYLHDGHMSLVRRAADECSHVVTTIFVNPLQFGPGEDLAAYPSDPDGDAAKAEDAGTTWLFTPSVEEMYPERVLTTVSVATVSRPMEGASRPTHFDGVATVVAKLFSIVGRCRAYFGEKDYQQLAVIRRMVEDLSMPVEVVGCPTLREADGLARSSRNVYLTEAERLAAPVLRRALLGGAMAIRQGETDAAIVRAFMTDLVDAEALAALDYVEVADPDSLEPLERCDRSARLFGAVRFGRARLIDNCAVDEVEP